MANPKTISLKSKGGVERKFDFSHALRLLRYEKATSKNNWSIKTKGYTFKDNEIIRSKGDVKKAKE